MKTTLVNSSARRRIILSVHSEIPTIKQERLKGSSVQFNQANNNKLVELADELHDCMANKLHESSVYGPQSTCLQNMGYKMNIEFVADEWYDHHRTKVVWFTAIVDEKTLECGISMEALANHFAAFYDDPLPAFRSHREHIQNTASKLIEQRRFEDDGRIIIRSADLE